MRALIHKFLCWFPAAVGGGAVAIAAVWSEAKIWIGKHVALWWLEMSDPWKAALMLLCVAAYVWAILYTGGERTSAGKRRGWTSFLGFNTPQPGLRTTIDSTPEPDMPDPALLRHGAYSEEELERRWPDQFAKPVEEQGYEEAFDEIAADRIPFIRLRDIARDNGLDFDHRIPGATNLAYALEGALRQAAVDGAIKVWGRKYRGAIKSNDPLVLIPAAHFEDYEFAHGNLHYPTLNPVTRTNTIQLAARGLEGVEGVTYYDLQLAHKDARAVVRQFAKESRQND